MASPVMIAATVVDTWWQWNRHLVDVLLNKELTREQRVHEMWDRTEDVQRELLHTWEEMGITHPVSVLAMTAEFTCTAYFLSLLRWPGTLLKVTAIFTLAPFLTALGGALLERPAGAAPRLRAIGGRDHPKTAAKRT